MKCIFCTNGLDNSDEHIILRSLNGKLSSTNIICSECNKFFGDNLDTIGKAYFKPIILILGLKNKEAIRFEDLDGNKDYLHRKDGKIELFKLDVKSKEIDGKTINYIRANEKNATKYYQKHYGGKPKSSIVPFISPLRTKVDFNTNTEINLLFNKIAIEYCAYKKIEIQDIGELARKVRAMDGKLNNVYYCNIEEDVRKFEKYEISHFIEVNVIDNKLYVYVELFNVICAVVLLSENYSGTPVSVQYYQDAITGEKFIDKQIYLNDEKIMELFKDRAVHKDMAPLVNKLFYRIQERKLMDAIDRKMESIVEKLNVKINNNEISSEEAKEIALDESTDFLAQLQMQNPYVFDDISEEEITLHNFLNSKLREHEFEDFCKNYESFIGLKVRYKEGEIYEVKEFMKSPYTNRKNTKIMCVYVVLSSEFDKQYIPYKVFFDKVIGTILRK